MTQTPRPDPRRSRRRPVRKASSPAFKPRDARFRILAEHSRDIFFSMRFPETRYEYISPSVEEIFGFAPRDFYADSATVLRCVAPAWRETVQGWIGEIAQGRVDDEYEFQVVDRAGRLRWLRQRQVLVPAPDGRGMLLQGMATDVTALRETQQALQQSEEHFRQLLEAWPEQVTLSVNLDAGRHEYVSPSMERVLGYAPQEFYDDPGLGMAVVAPQWQDEAWGWIAEIKGGLLRPCYEFELVHKNGQHRWIHQVGVLRPRGPGQDLVAQFTFRDITEERATREALRASEERFRNLAESWTDQVVMRISLATGRPEYVSPSMERVFGHRPETVCAQSDPPHLVVAPQWRETIGLWLEENRQGMIRPEYQYELIDAQGQMRWVSARGVLLKDDLGQPAVVQFVLVDITERRRLEEELRNSKAFLECIIEQSPMSMWISDDKGTLIRCNQALRELFKVSEEEVAGRFNIFRDNQVLEQGVMPQIRQVFEQGGTARFMLPYDTARIEGLELARSSAGFLEVTISAVQDAQGRTTSLIVQHLDITEHKRMEAALRESHARYQRIVEMANEGIMTIDADKRINYCNKVMAEMLGYDEQELYTLRFFDLIFDEDMPRHEVETERRMSGLSTRFERRFRRKDGMELWTIFAGTPILDEKGTYCGAFGMFTDITERRRAEAALSESEERFREVVEGTQSFITQVDASGRFTYVNPVARKVLGLEPGDCVGLMAFDIIHPDDRESTIAAFHGWVAGRLSDTTYENRLVSQSGEVRHLSWIIHLRYDPDGNVTVIDSIARDITDQKRAEAKIREQERVSHILARLAGDLLECEDRAQVQGLAGLAARQLCGSRESWIGHVDVQSGELVWAGGRSAPAGAVVVPVLHAGAQVGLIAVDRTAAELGALEPERLERLAALLAMATARILARKALRKSERLSRKLLESMHEGVWAVDADRRTTFVNERLCAMLGYSSAELMDMSPLDLLEWPQRQVAETRLLENGDVLSGATDFVLTRKDGSRFPAHVMSSPVIEAQGRFEGLVCGVVDVTERTRMEHELRRNQARFEALYELSRLRPATEQQLAAFTLREAIRLTDSTAGVLFFVSEDGQDLVPKAWETGEFMAAGTVPNFPANGSRPWAQVLETGQPLLVNDPAELAGLVPPGHPELTRFLGVPALDGNQPVAVLGLTGRVPPYTAESTLQTTLLLDGMWSVVRARRDEGRIRASLKEKEALLHEVHHRVKNNLQVVSSLLDLAGRRLTSSEARLSLDEVRGKVQAMSLIHAQLHSAGNAGGISLERFVRALFNQLRELYSGDLSLSLVVELSFMTLGLDQAVPLGLALNEALTNVFKHANSEGRAGRVVIRAGQAANGQVCIMVRDDGPGLPEGLDPGRAQSLGMKLMHGLVCHQLGGKLEVLSCAPPEPPGVEVCICFRSKIVK